MKTKDKLVSYKEQQKCRKLTEFFEEEDEDD